MRALVRAGWPALMPFLLGACSSLSSGINPVSWWHDLEGGTVGQQRPPPPNADAPYPNLASVPGKPKPPDPAMKTRISNALIADRANANYAAAQAPIPAPGGHAGAPSLFGGPVPPAPAADPDASSASLPAASAPPPVMPFKPAPPPAPATPPARAPRVGVGQAPLAAPAPSEAASAPPTIPDAPPPPPVLPGVGIPVTAPAPPPVAPPPLPAAPRAVTAADRVPVAFAPGSAIIPAGADAPLKHLATIIKGAKSIEVTGFGESNTDTPDAQTAAVKLGLLRAQAIAGVLASAGVPATFMRIDAQADGTGGEARLAN